MPNAKIAIRVHPRAKRTELAGFREAVLQIRVTAPALEGKANKAACDVVAKELGLSRSSVTILHGAHSRNKLMQISGMDQAAAHARLSQRAR